MNSKLKEILSQVYELEGLLLTAENHGKNTNALVFELIQKKIENIYSSGASIDNSIFDSEPAATFTVNQESAPKEPTKESEEKPFEGREFETLGADTNYDSDEDDEVVDEQESDQVVDNVSTDDEVVTDETEPTEDEAETETETETEESLEEEEQKSDENFQDNAEIEDESEDEGETEGDIATEDEAKDEVEPDVEPDVEPKEEEVESEDEIEEEEYADEDDSELDDEDEYLDDQEEEDSISVEDAVLRNKSKNLKKAFTLNDRFRFRRELFENSDVQMNDTLNMVEVMQSYSEAEDYFYTDLQWDSESPEVQDFMEIVKNHFS